MTIDELAEYFGTTPLEFRRLIFRSATPTFRVFKYRGKLCANLEDVQDWLLSILDEPDDH
jgi:hypothetical protein